jgi:hypothetical protein
MGLVRREAGRGVRVSRLSGLASVLASIYADTSSIYQSAYNDEGGEWVPGIGGDLLA